MTPSPPPSSATPAVQHQSNRVVAPTTSTTLVQASVLHSDSSIATTMPLPVDISHLPPTSLTETMVSPPTTTLTNTAPATTLTLRSKAEFFMTGVIPVPAQPDATCSTCLEPLIEDVVEMVKCGHTFHCACILPWFQGTAQRRCTCPNCRTELFKPKPLSMRSVPVPPRTTLDSAGGGGGGSVQRGPRSRTHWSENLDPSLRELQRLAGDQADSITSFVAAYARAHPTSSPHEPRSPPNWPPLFNTITPDSLLRRHTSDDLRAQRQEELGLGRMNARDQALAPQQPQRGDHAEPLESTGGNETSRASVSLGESENDGPSQDAVAPPQQVPQELEIEAEQLLGDDHSESSSDTQIENEITALRALLSNTDGSVRVPAPVPVSRASTSQLTTQLEGDSNNTHSHTSNLDFRDPNARPSSRHQNNRARLHSIAQRENTTPTPPSERHLVTGIRAVNRQEQYVHVENGPRSRAFAAARDAIRRSNEQLAADLMSEDRDILARTSARLIELEHRMELYYTLLSGPVRPDPTTPTTRVSQSGRRFPVVSTQNQDSETVRPVSQNLATLPRHAPNTEASGNEDSTCSTTDSRPSSTR
ncbi:hypothetical protein EKO04_009223 [Ascochyta lentis]|uniref:RING-type domain-containing protein n=1 Tax=Ascochyta lentis TaxID=205686 RepID=A0A8H7IVA8_9PLEO|nr:hypothetical protein EKO04_009223 [Ascochyta lentis]